MEDSIIKADGYHVPVLLEESLEQLITNPDGIYIDATFGGGGHSREILKRLSPEGHLFGFDKDPDALSNCDISDERFTFVRSDFRYLSFFMNYYGVKSVDGILADLGLSSHHLDDEGRGFSFRFDAPIDMRMNKAGGTTAQDLIENSTQEDLSSILKEYGEIKGAYRIAGLMKEASQRGELKSIQNLLDAIAPASPPHDKKNLSRIFQALRIAVNDEMGSLEALLQQGADLLASDGRFTIITYHSLEDRPVKNFFKTGNLQGERITDHFGVSHSPLKPLRNKPTTPTESELEKNPRSRSAKLRTALKL